MTDPVTWWRRPAVLGVVVAVAVAGVGVALGVDVPGGPSSGAGTAGLAKLHLLPATAAGHLVPAPPLGPVGAEGVPVPKAPLLASVDREHRGGRVDGIGCSTSEQVAFHVHTRLTVFVDGSPRRIPEGIGIAPPRRVETTPAGRFVTGGACFYWLHTHAPDGIIHIESPVERAFTLGELFAIWRQPLSATQVGPAHGPVTAFFDGKLFRGDPGRLPLGDHVQIQLDVGRPLVAPERFRFPSNL